MKGSEAKLVSYMQGSDKRFIIPVYQRNYDWKTENCKQLYDDLVKVIQKQRQSHFFGSIVSVHNDGTYNEFLVIDGQQRLTTVSLLLLAMYNLMKDGIVTPSQNNLADKIYKTYLIDEWQEDETRIKLKPVKNDRHAFDCLFKDASEFVQESNLTINYNYFYTRIQKEEISVDELYSAITKLEIINITLNQEDNPQLIFESLNSTGVALSEGDKIRNYILMGLPNDLQNDYYEKYWNKIEICTGYAVSLFIRDYLSVKQQAIPSMDKVYSTFKNYVEDGKIATEELLKDLLAYAQRYEILLKGKTPDKELNACIFRLNRLESTVTRPFFLEVLRMQAQGMAWTDVREIFRFTENYLFRRTICDLPTNALNKIFLMLHKEVFRYENNSEHYLDKFKYALLSKTDRGRFPDDTEFSEAFGTRQIYLMNGKNKIYILERLENFGTIEDKDIYRHCDDGDYSIEHIMPQHLTPAWIDALGKDDYEQIHETWLHRIANLALTGYNSKYSNSSFVEKRDMPNGFRESGLKMNVWIGQQESWGVSQLEERTSILNARALAIWSYPKTDFKPAAKQMDSCTLEDDTDLSGRILAKYGYRNTEQPVESWVQMMEQVLKMLHNEDKSVLLKLAYADSSDGDLSAYVSNDPQKLRGTIEIDNGIYFERNTSTATKISILRKLFKAYDANTEDLIFFLRDATEVSTEEEKGTRYELRRRYWKYALDYIHEAHGEHGSFSNVNPSKENWISGFVGISGVSINCTANYDCARVEFYLGSSVKETNKARFDFLYQHKEEIESKLGKPLEWLRSDDTKAAFVLIRLPEVSIKNETDWIMMAKFHAEWSKKFYDVLVPYLK